MKLHYQSLFDVTVSIALFVVIGMFLILFEPRHSTKRFLCSLIPFLLLWFGGNIYILLAYGIEVSSKYVLLTATLPSLLYFLAVARSRDGRFFFTFCLCDTVMAWALIVTNLIDYAVGGEGLVAVILRLAAFPVMLLLTWRLVRKPYLALLHTVSRGWWLFAAMTGLFYVTMAVIAGIPTVIRRRPEDMPVAVMVLILLPLTYATIFIVLRQQDELFHIQERQRIFETQAAMMNHRVEDMRRAEEAMRIERHDMRHQLQTVASLAQKGDCAALQDYIGTAQAKLNAAMPRSYCTDPILDAVLVSAAVQAERLDIDIEMAVALPEELPADALELSIIFANALENAIQAVAKLPDGQRRIICKSVTYPRFMMEVSNPYVGEITFDRRGFPMTDKPGHGIGTRSIVAFAEKHNALCLFRAENGWFKLQVTV